ncbi:MAG: thiamine diphosphokinase [Bacteroidales bacterium]|nr:thiamine diphosphokinase [Bacteroidales bacterium]
MDVGEAAEFWDREFAKTDTVIVGNGEAPASPESLKLLKSGKRIVCCDGAFNKLMALGVFPDVIVGDGDSADLQEARRHGIPFCQDTSQEYNDLQKAFRYCIANGYGRIALIGCAGLREDHFIANLSIMAMYSRNLEYVAMLTEHGLFNVFRKSATLDSSEGMQVSVFTKDPSIRLTFSGLKYKVENRRFGWLWEGSLNESLGGKFTVESDSDLPFVVYRAK